MNKRLKLLFNIIIICLLMGCSDNRFETNYLKLKESYLLATDFLENDTDSINALKTINYNITESELTKMRTAMESMSTEQNTNNQKGTYNNVKKYCEHVEFLLYAAKNIENLSFDEKGMIYAIVDIVEMDREKILKGEL